MATSSPMDAHWPCGDSETLTLDPAAGTNPSESIGNDVFREAGTRRLGTAKCFRIHL